MNTGKYQSIAFNFLNKFKRINTLNSIDQTGSLVLFNVSVLLKYFFKLIGGALISKPVFEFKHNKVVIKLFFFIKKNIIFFKDNQATASIPENMKNLFLANELTQYAPILRNISNNLNFKLRTEMLNDKVEVNKSSLAYALKNLINKGERDELTLNNIGAVA